MADDARTEARRRIAEAMHAHDCGCSGYSVDTDPLAEREVFERRADAVLDLFPDAEWAYLWQGAGLILPAEPPRATHRRLVLASALELVEPGELQP